MSEEMDKDYSKSATNLLDLPSEIIRIILADLTDEDVYFNVRKASRRLRDIADDVVQLGNFILS